MTPPAILRSSLVAALTVVLTATPASADVWRHRDARGDAVVVDESGSTVDPTNRSADITRLVVHHTAHAVIVQLHLRDLEAVGYANGRIRLKTPQRTYQALAYLGPDDPGSVELSHGQHGVGCSRMSARFRPRSEKVRVRLPRTCLDDPRWVRVGAAYTRFDGPDDPDPQGTFHDDALAVGEDAAPTVWSPRLRPAQPKPGPPLTLHAAYGWADRRAVGLHMTDGLATLEVSALRGVEIERVRAPFDSGVRVIGLRFARPDREIGGVLVHQWPTHELDWSRTLPARGAHLTPTSRGQEWLLLIGYEVTRPGRHLRPTIRIDYRVGNRHLSVASHTPGLICAGRTTRHRPCRPTDSELGDLGRASLRAPPAVIGGAVVSRYVDGRGGWSIPSRRRGPVDRSSR